MKIVSTQKIIKVGTSSMVTVPAKEMRHMGLGNGDNVKVTYEATETAPDKHTLQVVDLTQKLIKRHKQALKNLSQR